MNFKLIACKVLYREIGLVTTRCPNYIDITYLRQGYHDYPDKLRAILQAEIDRVDDGSDPYTSDTCKMGSDFDAILLGYGLCSNGVIGVRSRKYKIVVPRAHDCMTLLLGSKQRYRDLFDNVGGIYWYTPGWIECTRIPSKRSYDLYYAMYLDEYGEENAEYLMEAQFDWRNKYRNLIYIKQDGLYFPHHESFSREAAEYLKWDFKMIEGSTSLLDNMLGGVWDDQDFLVIEPSQTLEPSFDETIIKAAP